MKVIIFGATGMVGGGVLRECLLDSGVEQVLTVGRNATGIRHEKLGELIHADMFDLASIEDELRGYDALLQAANPTSAPSRVNRLWR